MKNRVDWIDAAKGIGMILVVYGHISYRPDWLNVWLCSFHMPLFFFLSGITYNAEKYSDFKVFIRNKIQTLVIPYLIFSVITLLWDTGWRLIYFFKDGTPIGLKQLAKSVLAIGVQIRGTSLGIGVWFIPCIFVAFIILHFILKLSRGNKIIAMSAATACLAAGYLYCTYVNIKLPWSIDAAFVAVFFMTAGNVLREHLLKKASVRIYIAGGVCLVVNIVFAYLNYRVLGRSVGMWSNNYGNFVFFICGAASGIVFVRAVTDAVRLRPLIFLGKNSIYYYGLHIMLVELFTKLILKTGMINNVTAFCFATAEVAVVLVILSLGLGYYKKLYNGIIGLTDKKIVYIGDTNG